MVWAPEWFFPTAFYPETLRCVECISMTRNDRIEIDRSYPVPCWPSSSLQELFFKLKPFPRLDWTTPWQDREGHLDEIEEFFQWYKFQLVRSGCITPEKWPSYWKFHLTSVHWHLEGRLIVGVWVPYQSFFQFQFDHSVEFTYSLGRNLSSERIDLLDFAHIQSILDAEIEILKRDHGILISNAAFASFLLSSSSKSLNLDNIKTLTMYWKENRTWMWIKLWSSKFGTTIKSGIIHQ